MSENLETDTTTDDSFKIPLEMQHTYWIRRQADLERLEAAFQDKTPDVFHKIGHQIKGNAATFGFVDLCDLGERMENMPDQDFLNLAPVFLTELKAWIKKSESLFSSI